MATNVKEKKLRDLRIQVAGPTEELNKLAWKVASEGGKPPAAAPASPQKRTASAVLDAKPMPKKARSAFFIWLFEVGRKEIIAEQFGGNGKDVAAIAKAASEKWGSMSAVDKKQWNEKAEKDKARYKEEMESYELSATSEPKKNSQSLRGGPTRYRDRIGQAPAAPQVQRCDTTPEQKRATRKLPAESEAKKVATGRRTTAAKKSTSKEPAKNTREKKPSTVVPLGQFLEEYYEQQKEKKRKKENGKGKTKENGKEEEKEGKKRSREGSDEDSRSDSSIASSSGSSSDSSSDSTESIPPAKRRKRIYRR